MATVYKLRPIQLVGRKIRQLRKEHNLTQTELSARVGIQQSDLSRMEKGEYRVSLDTLFRILSEFQISFGEFFDEMAKESMTDRDQRLVQDFKGLDESSRREVEELIAKKAPSPQQATARRLAAGRHPSLAAQGAGSTAGKG
jgi:transcriptional regulator with XRE-family HTH domain